MTPFRPDRRRRGPDPFLGQKMLLFVLGAILGVAGMATDQPWLVYAAAAALSLGVMLRFFGRERRRSADDAEDDGEYDVEEDADVAGEADVAHTEPDGPDDDDTARG